MGYVIKLVSSEVPYLGLFFHRGSCGAVLNPFHPLGLTNQEWILTVRLKPTWNTVHLNVPLFDYEKKLFSVKKRSQVGVDSLTVQPFREQFQLLEIPRFQGSLLNSTWSKMPAEAVGEPTGFCQVWKSDSVDRDPISDLPPKNYHLTCTCSLATSQAGARVLVSGFK